MPAEGAWLGAGHLCLSMSWASLVVPVVPRELPSRFRHLRGRGGVGGRQSAQRGEGSVAAGMRGRGLT